MTNTELNYIMAEFKPIADSIKDFSKKHGFNHVSVLDFGFELEMDVFNDIPDDPKHFYVDKFFYRENEIRKETELFERRL